MDKNFSYNSNFKYFIFSTIYTGKEKLLMEEIDALTEVVRRKQMELSNLQKEIVLEHLLSCGEKFSWGEIAYNLTTGTQYLITKTSPLEISKIDYSI